jgi:protocatechuate 3,4-dioxygenase beta subunit
VPLTLDIQLIDDNTCEPIIRVYLEAWHCNATGVYSGVVAENNGDSADEENLDATFLRGVNVLDNDAVASFDTVIPGHYTGSAVSLLSIP